MTQGHRDPGCGPSPILTVTPDSTQDRSVVMRPVSLSVRTAVTRATTTTVSARAERADESQSELSSAGEVHSKVDGVAGVLEDGRGGEELLYHRAVVRVIAVSDEVNVERTVQQEKSAAGSNQHCRS